MVFGEEILLGCSWAVTVASLLQAADPEGRAGQGAGGRPVHAVPGGGGGDL